MRTHERLKFAGSIAILVLAAIGVAWLWPKPASHESASDLPATTLPPPIESTALSGSHIQHSTHQEKPIEELLLESGENAEAVMYVSRIREATQGKNMEFARELFRQMLSTHGDSVLIDEATRLIEEQ